MTKTKHIPYSGQDKHLQRGGLRDLRGSPTKKGAGKGNWGSINDEILNYETAYVPKGQVENKIQVCIILK
ncbi:hypothetical protein H8356DRAFT_1065733 [Neocallimastix lanati (nom. inval.)]|jgi:hypothetical protein|nr:hypothetical protein H8356DRAFT_1065733 [Neocallimastix sp. JGI-2020a]